MRKNSDSIFLFLVAGACLVVCITVVFFVPPKQVNKNEIDKTTKVEEVFSVSFPDPAVELILVGDVMLGRTVMQKTEEVNNWSYPFLKVRDITKNADIVFVNLENPVIKDCPPHDSGYKFCSKPEMLEGLAEAGIDIVSLANNHSLNYGKEGLLSSVDYLESFGIRSTGLGTLEIIEKRGLVFGFLGFDFVSGKPKDNDFGLVKNSKNLVDVLVVGVHWGSEYQSEHGDLQEEWANNFIDSGADVVVGHHPHWVQDYVYIEGKPVYYSLGNFVFDQMWSEETRKGLMVSLFFEDGEIVDEKFIPVYMSNWAQPEPVNI